MVPLTVVTAHTIDKAKEHKGWTGNSDFCIWTREGSKKPEKEPLSELSDGNVTVRREYGSSNEGNLLEAVVNSNFTN